MLLAGVVLTLASCAAQRTTVASVVAGKESHLQTHFNAGKVNAGAQSALAAEAGAAAPFRRAVLRMEYDSDTEGRRTTPRAVMTMLPAERGLLMRMTEFSNNDIAYRINYELTQRGLVSLRWQTVFMNQVNTELIYETKSVTTALPAVATIRPGVTYSVQFATGSEVQLAGFSGQRQDCKVGAAFSAREVHPRFSGQALPIDCDHFFNDVVQDKTTRIYLVDYGFAFQSSFKSSRASNTVRVIDVDIER